jgi:hypothetical protein
MFYFVLKACVAINQFPWSRRGLQAIEVSFYTKNKLGPELYPFLVDFLKRIVKRAKSDDHQ